MNVQGFRFLMVTLVYLHCFQDEPETADLKLFSFLETIDEAKHGKRVYPDDGMNFYLSTIPDKLLTNFTMGYFLATREKYDIKTGQEKIRRKIINIFINEGIPEDEILKECEKSKAIADLMVNGIHIDMTGSENNE